MELLDGKLLSQQIKDELKVEVEALVAAGNRPPHLVAILIGENPASQTYVRNKVRACDYSGYRSTELLYDTSVKERYLLRKLASLNADPEVDGILVQLPLPDHISAPKVIETIAPEKDVDGFHPINIGRMAKGLPAPLPATPAGILEILRRYKLPTQGKEVIVVGNSNIVGSPVSILLARESYPGQATVTICHIHTQDLASHTRRADILIVATGVVNLITSDMVKEGVVIIDVGINRIKDASRKSGFRLVGDVDFPGVSPKCSYITPVPGGVGPMTIAMLLKNTMQLYREHLGLAPHQ
ncbi:MAG TPA: bifunctional 5,10-methylenetetrahydrofolate dehydrogenase/5,10-methenyltetrahydrofolate cyclohydrolase [Bacteroidetes bacterium]|nr:bifunctional 5,10-methylenetetrahydrofolate dehydrogenase/5,10-methenyltetrahydrofolate cyclohydrolase [Bacteroidota bacterium]